MTSWVYSLAVQTVLSSAMRYRTELWFKSTCYQTSRCTARWLLWHM